MEKILKNDYECQDDRATKKKLFISRTRGTYIELYKLD